MKDKKGLIMEKTTEEKTFKIHSYKAFPYSEMKKVLLAIEKLGYNIELVDNGNISCTIIKSEIK